MSESNMFSLQEALKAQSALRSAAGLEPEMFSVNAFVGMISDEIDSLREKGKTDEEIASLIKKKSAIEITSRKLPRITRRPKNDIRAELND